MPLASSYPTTSYVLNMKTWPEAMRDGAITGAVASVVSTAALGACSVTEKHSPYAPTNAISHVVWGDRATHEDAPSMRYTLLGYGIHLASSVAWGILYEKWFGQLAQKKSLAPALVSGAAMAGLTYVVDYKLTPKRLQPGFESRLSSRSMGLFYAAFGTGLVLRGLLSARRR
jgi:hypothetical protein